MAKRILLIPKEHEAQTLMSVTLLPTNVQRQIALHEFTLEQFTDILNSGKNEITDDIQNGNLFVVTYEDNYVEVPLANQENFDIESDNIFIRLVRQDEGFSLSVSSVPEMDRAREENEEHDPLYSAYFSDDELK